MDDEKDIITKDYTEEFDDLEDEEIDDEEEDYSENEEEENIEEEIESEDEESQNEEISDDKEVVPITKEDKPKNSKKKIILITIIILLVLACIVCTIILVINNKKDNNKDKEEVAKIVRPSEKEDYIALKQSYFNMVCKQTASGEKYKKLTKGLVIDCVFGYALNSDIKVSELYFDLGNSANVKLKRMKNDTTFKVINEKKTYKLTPENPEGALTEGLHFYFEVLNNTDETGYVEVSNIVFKDSNDKYYKVVNSLESFPPEYDDKIYIYKDIYGENGEKEYYFSSKVKYTDQELVDTFQCKNESCETKTETNTYFLINDEGLLVYDTINKTTNTIKTQNNFKVDDYSYEFMLNPQGNLYGIAFKKNYISAYDCEKNESICINTGLSGFELGYYSLALNTFTIDPELGFIGSSAYNNYDVAMMIKKDNKIGVFSYEDDDMMIDLTDKYKSAQYDNDTESIMLEVYDSKNKQYYFEYFNPKYALFMVDTDKVQKYDNSSIYYTTAYNRNGIKVTMLFDSKGKQLKNLPYVVSDNLISVTDKIVVKNNLYEIYDLKGNQLYSSKYDPKNILATTPSFIVAISENRIMLLNAEGKDLVKIKDLDSGVKFVSAEEQEEGVLVVIIKDDSIKENGKNAYKYTIEFNKPFQIETIYVK